MDTKSQSNIYQDALGETYDKTPKAVLAAICASLLSSGGEHLDRAPYGIRREWWTLHRAGIVPQRPPFPDPEPEAED